MNMKAFKKMFPDYFEYKVPMWSNWKTGETSDILEITIPGFERKDFKLVAIGDKLELTITNIEKSISYSIVDSSFTTDYNLAEAKARYKSGILYIEIPKVVKNKIEIGVSD